MNIQEMKNKSNDSANYQIYCAILRETTSKPVFQDEIRKKNFLDMLLDMRKRFSVEVYAYCVMDGEAFLLTGVTQRGQMDMAVGHLEKMFERYYNHQYPEKTISLYHDILMKGSISKPRILEECIWIHEMPHMQGWVRKAEDYWWSSLKEYLLKYQSGIIQPEPMLECLDSNRRKALQKLRRLQNEQSARNTTQNA